MTERPKPMEAIRTTPEAGRKRSRESKPRLQPESLNSWRQWLASQHKTSAGVWLIAYKKATGRQAFDFDLAIEEALCFGWIDSLPKALDEERTMLWFSPRKRNAAWSGINQQRVLRLLAEGRMQPAGLEVIAAAKTNCAWSRGGNHGSRGWHGCSCKRATEER